MEAPDAKGNRKVLLMWKGMQPPDACSALQGYQMTITPGDGHPQTLFFNLSEWRTWTVLGKEAHRISIIAYTSNDTSPGDTLTIPAVGAELPSVAGAQASPHDNQIRISWNNSHIPVQKYVIDWSTDGETYDWHATNSTSFSLTGELEPFKCYSIAVTPLYEDEAGREVTLQTYLEEGVPGQIQKVEVLDVQDDAATIKWTAVPEQERRGCIRNYTVYYASETGLALSDTVNASVFEYHLTRLRPSTKYTLYVLASTGKGGTNSSMSVFTTFQYGASFMKVALLCGGLGIVFMASIVISCFIMARKHLFPKLNIPSSIADLPFQHSPKASLNNLGHCPETIVKVFHVIEPLNLKCPELGCSLENTVVQPPGLDLSSGGKPTTDVPSATDDSATSLNEPGCPVLSADEQSADEQSADSTSYTEGAEERLLIPSSYVKHGESSPPNSSSGPAQEPATGPDQKVPRNPQQSIPGPAYVTVHMFTQTADCTRLL
ncbi:IL31R protein, partial [Amia calva]|nr:IL31R protein [Amia calva]